MALRPLYQLIVKETTSTELTSALQWLRGNASRRRLTIVESGEGRFEEVKQLRHSPGTQDRLCTPKSGDSRTSPAVHAGWLSITSRPCLNLN